MIYISTLKIFEILLNFNWGDVPTWLGAIGTVGTLVFTLIQLHKDRIERKINELKSQAINISSWISEENEENIVFKLNNMSNAPVYEVVLTLVITHGSGSYYDGQGVGEEYRNRNIFKILPPGKFETKMPYPGKGMNIIFGTEIAFKDVKGNSWVRKGDGNLIFIKQNPLEYYQISFPVLWKSYEELKEYKM